MLFESRNILTSVIRYFGHLGSLSFFVFSFSGRFFDLAFSFFDRRCKIFSCSDKRNFNETAQTDQITEPSVTNLSHFRPHRLPGI